MFFWQTLFDYQLSLRIFWSFWNFEFLNFKIYLIFTYIGKNWFENSEPIFTKSGNRQKSSYEVLLKLCKNVHDKIQLNEELIRKVKK